MKIGQVVTYISPDGAFGGPTRVALEQAKALGRRGHEVTVFAAAPVTSPQIERLGNGVTLRKYPAKWVSKRLGFAGMHAPGLSRDLRASATHFDVVHLHLARDLVTLPAAHAVQRGGVPYVAQTHGMIDASTHPLAGPIDLVSTRRAIRQAHRVLVLTDQEEQDITSLVPRAAIARIGNGVEVRQPRAYEPRPPRVLFLARLHERKRPLAFIEMAELVGAVHAEAEFVVAGPDEGEGQRVVEAIASSSLRNRLQWIGPVDPERTSSLLADARVFVLPSVGEVFPMTVLEAFQEGTPVVTTDSLGIADMCRTHQAAEVTDGTPSGLATAVSRVLSSTARAHELRAGASSLLRQELNIDDVAATLEEHYGSARQTVRRNKGGN